MRTCPQLLGREAELELLQQALGAAASSSPIVVLVHGDAGIGKTRLVEEFLQSADSPAVWLNCAGASMAVPFGALNDGLGSRLGHLSFADSGLLGPGSTADRAAAKLRHHGALSDAVAATVREAGTSVVVIEDLHWCDDATLEWLPHLVRVNADRLLLVVTFRDERSAPAMARCLAELDRLRVTRDVPLEPLPTAETVRLVELMAPGTRRPAEVADLSGGNPLYAEELCHLAAMDLPRGVDRSTVPRVVVAAFDHRRRSLSVGATNALWAAAVLGREFSAGVLRAAASGVTDAELAVDELVEAGLLTVSAPGRFSIRHVLFQAAALESMTPSQRAGMHRSVAMALESGLTGRAELRAAELVHHWSIVGDVDKVALWAAVACDQAFAVHRPSDAKSHADAAIELLVRERGEASHGLLRRRGEANAWLGDFVGAEQDHRAALGAALSSGEIGHRWRTLLDLGALSVERDFRQSGDYLTEALALARDLDDEHGLAETLAWVGFWHMMDGNPQIALSHQREALEIFERLGDRRHAGEVLDLLGWTNYTLSDLSASRDAYRSGIAVNQAVSNGQALASCEAGYATRGADCFQLDALWCDGEPLAWAADGEAAIERARSIGWRSGEARAAIWLGLHLAALGQCGRALELARQGIEIATSDGQVRFASTGHILYSAIWLDLLEPARALEHGESAWRLANELHSPTVAATAASFIVRGHIAVGSLDAAHAVLENVAPLAPNSMPNRLITSARAELALAAGDFDRAFSAADGLSRAAPRTEHGQVVPRLSYLSGLALCGFGHDEEADTCFAEAASAAARLRQRPLLWRILLAAGDVTARLGGVATAADCYRSAQRVVDEIGATIPNANTASSFRASASSRIPSVAGPARGGVGLTAREREIAILVARGLSNREIADHLVLSVRTVEKHVANALMKLHMRSRVELAVWAASDTLQRSQRGQSARPN